jgi:glycosyltransferase involved in cell wall biosynthesis
MPRPSARIAVIVPTFEPGAYLDRCLLSLDAQLLGKEAFRVYIGLNGTRHPYEARVHAALAATTLPHEYVYLPDAGVSHCRNALLDRTEEEFIAFIDDDDVVSPNYLGNLLAVADRTHLGIANVRGFVDDLATQRDIFVGKSFARLAPTERSKFKARKYFSSPWATMMHRDIIGRHRFDRRLAKAEDALFMATLSSQVEGVRKAPADTFYFVCERAGSVTRRPVPLRTELAMQSYLLRRYLRLLVSPRYDVPFMLTRVAATVLKIVRALGRAARFPSLRNR